MKEKQSTDWVLNVDEFLIPTYEEWEQVAISSLKGKPIEQLFSPTHEGIILKPIYTSSDEGLPKHKMINNKTNNTWIINQELSASTTTELVLSIDRALRYGQLSINFQLKTQEFQDGVEITTIEDLVQVLKSIPNQKLTFLVDTKLQQSAFLVALLSSAKKMKKAVKGVIGTDPIGEWIRNGKLPSSLAFYYEEMAVMLKESKEFPHLKTILVKSHPFHNGGANAVQELAYTLSVGIEYVRQYLNRGIEINDIAQKMAFSFSVGSNMFMEIAKLRAARFLWASIIHEFGGDSKSQQMWIHAKTSTTTKTTYDPYVNMLRATVESFSAVVGGADSIQTSPFNEAFQKATPFSDRIARNVQSILLEEANLGRVVDPSKGSWYIESLTKHVSEKAWDIIQQLDSKGGIIDGLLEGTIQKDIGKIRDERFNKIESRKERIVGVNMYANVQEKEQLSSLNQDLNTAHLIIKETQLLELSIKQPDLIPLIERELEKGHTFTDLQKSLLDQQKEEEIDAIPEIRWSMKYEMLRNNAVNYYKQTGEQLAVRLVNVGELIQHKPRTDFIKGFFEVGGFHIKETSSLTTIEDIRKEIGLLTDRIIIICGDDSTYSRMGRDVVELIKKENPESHVFVAGRINPMVFSEYVEAGLKDCIHISTNCYQFLLSLQKDLEVNHEIS
jgi:methylmalonyl-CoA mutase